MKKTRLHAPALVGVLVSVVAFSAGPAWGDQSSRPALGNRISKCGTISKPGSYVLTRNLTAIGDCLVVAANFVTIDLGGWVITGNGTWERDHRPGRWHGGASPCVMGQSPASTPVWTWAQARTLLLRRCGPRRKSWHRTALASVTGSSSIVSGNIAGAGHFRDRRRSR